MELTIETLLGVGEEVEGGVQCGYFIPKDEKQGADADGDSTSEDEDTAGGDKVIEIADSDDPGDTPLRKSKTKRRKSKADKPKVDKGKGKAPATSAQPRTAASKRPTTAVEEEQISDGEAWFRQQEAAKRAQKAAAPKVNKPASEVARRPKQPAAPNPGNATNENGKRPASDATATTPSKPKKARGAGALGAGSSSTPRFSQKEPKESPAAKRKRMDAIQKKL